MNGVRRLIRPGLEHFETLYRHALRLEAVGPVLLLGTGRHASAAIELPDGTRIERGAVIGRLHINNARIAALQASGRHDAGVRFARLLRESFATLAGLAYSSEPWMGVQLYEGLTWFGQHGRTVGFESQCVPSGLRRLYLSLHFKVLIWAFAPAARSEAMAGVEPRLFRITRRTLIKNFGSVEERSRPSIRAVP